MSDGRGGLRVFVEACISEAAPTKVVIQLDRAGKRSFSLSTECAREFAAQLLAAVDVATATDTAMEPLDRGEAEPMDEVTP